MNVVMNAVGIGQGAKVQLHPRWPSSKELTHQVGKLSSTNLKEQLQCDSGPTTKSCHGCLTV